MIGLVSFLGWSIPVLVLPFSYALFRWVPFRRSRLILYGAILLSAFIFDLLSVSFRAEMLDVVFHFSLMIVLVEIYWNLSGLRWKKFFWISLLPALLVYFIINMPWLAGGPSSSEIRHNTSVASLRRDDTTYTLKKRLSRDIRTPSYVFTLSRSIPNTPFEKRLDSYVTPDGYFNAIYSHTWNEDSSSTVCLSLIADKDTLWRLEEKR